MQRVVSGIVVFLSIALPALWPTAARALGVYEDAAGEAGFLFARPNTAVIATLHRTDGGSRDASIFAIAASFPVREGMLVQIEQPFVTVAGTSDIETGFGDVVARARMRLLGGDGRVLRLTGGLRLGTGTHALYPYSSQSYDMQLGVGYVDSLRSAHLWGAAQGVVVKRAPDGLTDETRHEDFIRLGGGLLLPFTRVLQARAGVAGLFYRSGGKREVYFAQLQYTYSPSIEIRLSAHAEAGKSDERVSDAAFTAAIHTYF